jgi:hypothetical protein
MVPPLSVFRKKQTNKKINLWLGQRYIYIPLPNSGGNTRASRACFEQPAYTCTTVMCHWEKHIHLPWWTCMNNKTESFLALMFSMSIYYLPQWEGAACWWFKISSSLPYHIPPHGDHHYHSSTPSKFQCNMHFLFVPLSLLIGLPVILQVLLLRSPR